MKKQLFAFFWVCLAACLPAYAQPLPKTQTTYIRTSAQCPTCKTTIENGMNVVKGVQLATLNLDSNIVIITYKTTKTNPDKLRKALTNIGYDADELPSNPRAYDALMTCCKKEYGKHDD